MDMQVNWLLDANVFREYHDELVAAIVRNGDVVKSINRPDPPYQWDDAPNRYRGLFEKGACVITHADIDLVRRVRNDRLWTPGAFANEENFYWSEYAPRLNRFLLNGSHVMLPFAELALRRSELFEQFGRDGRIFVRPDSPLKIFSGQLASLETFDRDLEFMAFYDFPHQNLVVVSSPKNIFGEWRVVVAEQSVVAASQNVDHGAKIAIPCDTKCILEFANDVLKTGFAPDPVWIMDICQTDDQQLHLLEIGIFSCSSLYGCDKDRVVKAVSTAARNAHRANAAFKP
jgi:hypothetical protein